MPGPELEVHMEGQNYEKRMTSLWNTLSWFVKMLNVICFFFSHLEWELEIWTHYFSPRPVIAKGNKLGGLKFYSLTVFEAIGLKSVGWQAMLPSKGSRGESFHDFSWLLVVTRNSWVPRLVHALL